MTQRKALVLTSGEHQLLQAGDSLNGYHADTANFAQTANDNFISMSASGGNRTVTLLAAATYGAGNSVTVIKSDSSANTVTISAASGNVGAFADYPLLLQNESVTLLCDGSNYVIVGKFVPVVWSSPTRTINTAFQISTRREYEVKYSVRVNMTSSGSQQTGRVELRTDSANPPTVSFGQSRTNQNIGGLLSGGLEVDIDSQIGSSIKPGDYVELHYVNETGSGSNSGLVVLSRERPI